MSTIFGTPASELLIGTIISDYIFALGGNDTLDGFGITFNNNELDEYTGGTGADVFVLGNATGAYYLNPLGLTERSYATITDFSAAEGDKIQVFGTATDYTFEIFQGGIDIIYRGDVIANVQNTTDVHLLKTSTKLVMFSLGTR